VKLRPAGWPRLYESKDGTEEKVFDAFEWLAAMTSHVPNKGEQMVRYYGCSNNVTRGKRKKNDHKLIPSILDPDGSSKEHRKICTPQYPEVYSPFFSSIYYPYNRHTTHHILSNIICMLEYLRTNTFCSQITTA